MRDKGTVKLHSNARPVCSKGLSACKDHLNDTLNSQKPYLSENKNCAQAEKSTCNKPSYWYFNNEGENNPASVFNTYSSYCCLIAYSQKIRRKGQRGRERWSEKVRECPGSRIACWPLGEPSSELRMNLQLEERRSQISLGATNRGGQPWVQHTST